MLRARTSCEVENSPVDDVCTLYFFLSGVLCGISLTSRSRLAILFKVELCAKRELDFRNVSRRKMLFVRETPELVVQTLVVARVTDVLVWNCECLHTRRGTTTSKLETGPSAESHSGSGSRVRQLSAWSLTKYTRALHSTPNSL